MKFSEFAHHIVIGDEMIVFDEIGDKYWILPPHQTDEVIKSINAESACSSSVVNDLMKAGLLVQGEQPRGINFSSNNVRSIDNHEWSYSFKSGITQVRRILLFQSALALISVCLGIKLLGLHRTLNILRRTKNSLNNQNTFDHHYISEISSGIKQASKFIPFKTSCLQHALGVCFLSATKGADVCMKIGVKNYDFIAHAWAEADCTVIGDRPDLPELLHVIFSI
ncbi:Transglutaminase-like superfamily protein [compost metagenome]